MKINKKKLIELLVDRTGMERAEVEDQLEQLVNRIIDAAERGKALEIKEFGLFYFDEDGELKFDPAKELSTEINFKYAGMEPVELKPARDEAGDPGQAEVSDEPPKTAESQKPQESEPEIEPEEPVETEDELADIFGFDDEDGDAVSKQGEAVDPFDIEAEDQDKSPADKKKLEEEAVPAEAETKPIEEPEEPVEDDTIPREDDPFAGLLSDASSKLTASDKRDFAEEDEEDDDLDDLLFTALDSEEKPDLEPESQKEPAKAGTAAAGKADSAASEKKPKKQSKPAAKGDSGPKRDPIMVVISVVLVFVLVAAAFLLVPGMFQSDDPETPTEQPPVTAETAPAPHQEDAVNVLSPVEPEVETEVTEDVAEEDEIPPETTTEQPEYGLMGDLVESANDGFSIVLHSLAREENAREQAASLALDGYRVLVSPRTVQERTVWRVSVGQFQTIADAQEHASELPSPYNTNNFIQRIQVN